MICVKGDLKTLNITILREMLFKLLSFHVTGDLLYKEVVINKSLRVGTKKLIVKRKTSARATINLEISENLASFLELFRVRNLNDGCVEGFVHISLNLRDTLKINTGFFKNF